jgi:hypothetical protein
MARYGLVVGVAKYKSPLGNLSKTESDAKAVNDLLKQYGDFEDIQVLTGEVTAKQIEDALGRLLLERSDRNEALIYFSGHAVVVKGNFGKKRGYFALSNTGLKTSSGEITGIENGIALDDLSGLIGEAKLSNLVVLLDCCHSETLLEESQGFLQRAIVSQAFAELKQDYFLVSACRKFEEAYAMKSERYSIFTGAMLRGLAKERANDLGVVDASTMFGYVAEQLRGTGQEAVSCGYGRASRIVNYRSISQVNEVNETSPYVGLNVFDEKLLQGGESSMLAAYLAQNSDNIATLISRLDQQKQIASGSKMEMLKIMIEQDALEGSQLSEASGRVLRRLMGLTESQKKDLDSNTSEQNILDVNTDDQDTFVNRYVHVEMDSEVLIQRVTTVEVKISNNLISIVNDSTSKSAEVKVDLSNSLIVQVIPKVNFENVGETRIEISPSDLEEQHNIYFDLRATHIGEGEIWVVFSQSQFPLLTLALTPKIVENKTRTSQRISKNGEVPPILKATEPLHQLCIIERRNGNQISYQYEFNSPSLNLLGLYESKLITSNRQEYVENLYREIESRWLSVQGDVDAFECELRAFGGQILDELFPDDLQRQLWEYRHDIQSIMVISTEPFIPWELVHLKPPRQSFLPEEVYFLGQMGLVRWLYDVGFPPESITIRPQRCYYVIPHYPDARYRLLQAEQEVQFLEQLFQATAIEPQPVAVREALESTSFDLLHFAGHGHADVNITTSAKLLLEGRIENGQYIHTYLSATTVGQFSRLKSFQNQPIVMINACQIGRLGYVLTGIGGFAQAFLKGGAGVFIGTLWSVGDQPARIFSETFYTSLIEGETLANATRKARETAKLSGDATWLAYVVYGHPHLKVTLNQDIDL